MAKLYYDEFEEIELEQTFKTQVEEELGGVQGAIESIRSCDIQPAVVVDVDKRRPPTPAALGDVCRLRHLRERKLISCRVVAKEDIVLRDSVDDPLVDVGDENI